MNAASNKSDKRNTWVLPDGVEERLPPGARRVEQMRRLVLDTFDAWGYDLVTPPLIEYLDSLLITDDEELDLKTFKLIDQLSGRLLGARADMTPQVARIDAHSLSHRAINRLCYAGSVLNTRPASVGESRAPHQFGAEIYGSKALTSDAEIVRLTLSVLDALKLDDLYLDLGHAGVVTGLIRMADLDMATEALVLDNLRRKSRHEMERDLKGLGDAVASPVRDMLCHLIDLCGERDALSRARTCLKGASRQVLDAVDDLERIADMVAGHVSATIQFDLAGSLGYRYQTGMTYAVYKPGCRRELARGGRYDDLGKIFGRARPAVGFSGDLYFLAETVLSNAEMSPHGIFAPCQNYQKDAALRDAVAHARAEGERVVEQLQADESAADEMCDREFYLADGEWRVRTVT